VNAQIDAIYLDVHGFLTRDEMALLKQLAANVPAGGRIVEIGSFEGKSAIMLGLGAHESHSVVYSIDPYEPHTIGAMVVSEGAYGAFVINMGRWGVDDVVTQIRKRDEDALAEWEHGFIELLFIDGSHEYEDVKRQLETWGELAREIALHDTSGNWPGVSQALDEFMADTDEWEVIERVDSITVIRRV
jgi:predicted O-methyltransferase YrrM